MPPPTRWELQQNDPNPFCGWTSIRWAAPQAAHVELTVKNPDGTQVLRVLVDGNLQAGVFTVLWDGRDGNGDLLAPGAYPYTLRATDSATQVVLHESSRTAHVDCLVATESRPWSAVKSLFR